MVFAKVALASGLLLLFAAFALGVDQRSTSVIDQSNDCGAAISPSWLVPGTPDRILNPGSGASAAERRTAAECRPVVNQSRVMILTTMGMGGLLAVIGWTALRERRESTPRQLTTIGV